jgi:anti-sigma regulatory factor (Ser/Thr protein kinase)
MGYQVLVLQPGFEAPGEARRAVQAWLGDWGMEDLADRVLIIASELVANAVAHAHSEVVLSLTACCHDVKVGVRDGDNRPLRLGSRMSAAGPAVQGPSRLPERGRGLTIVDALADAWGVEQMRDGKRVWARVSTAGD